MFRLNVTEYISIRYGGMLPLRQKFFAENTLPLQDVCSWLLPGQGADTCARCVPAIHCIVLRMVPFPLFPATYRVGIFAIFQHNTVEEEMRRTVLPARTGYALLPAFALLAALLLPPARQYPQFPPRRDAERGAVSTGLGVRCQLVWGCGVSRPGACGVSRPGACGFNRPGTYGIN